MDAAPGERVAEEESRGSAFWLGLILAAGLALRLWGIGFGLPNLHCRPDESTLVDKALAIGAGDLNPHFFNYPSFHFYLLALLYGAYYAIGRAIGWFSGVADFERLFFFNPSSFYLLGRICSAALGTASVGLAYLLGRKLDGRRAGLLSALFLSLAFLHVRDSHFATVDVPAVFHLLLGWVFLLRYLERAGWGDLFGSAILFGLATSTKYNLGVFGIAVLGAPWLIAGQKGKRPGLQMAGALLAMGAAFVAGSPYALLDFGNFWRDLNYERLHFIAGHGGRDLGRGWLYHLRFTLYYGLGWPLLLVALAGWVRLAWRRRLADLLLIGSLLLYGGVAGSGRGVFMRYLLPLVPLLCVVAGGGLATWGRRWGGWTALAGLLVALPSGWAAWQHDRLLVQADTRVLAAHWIEARLPDGAWIAMHGSDFGYPQVRRSRSGLHQELEDIRAAGLPGKRLERMLQLEGYPPPPSYNVVELKGVNPFGRRSVWTQCDIDYLRSKGIEWVVTHEHPLAYSRVDPTFRAQLEREAVLVQCFDPFRASGEIPVFDPLDAYYVPVAGFEGVERPGPLIRIYALRPTSLSRD